MSAKPPLKIVLCSPRGFCAGVVRAIDTVERALTIYGAPVYVRHEIVHNKYVVDSLRDQRRDFRRGTWPKSPTTPTRRWCSPPTGFPNRCQPTPAPGNFFFAGRHLSAGHQGAPRGCDPFQAWAAKSCLIGHSHHPEVVGTLGPARRAGAVTLIETAHDAATFTPKDPNNLALVTHTTLSIDDTAEIVALLKARFRTSPDPTWKISATPPPTASSR